MKFAVINVFTKTLQTLQFTGQQDNWTGKIINLYQINDKFTGPNVFFTQNQIYDNLFINPYSGMQNCRRQHVFFFFIILFFYFYHQPL